MDESIAACEPSWILDDLSTTCVARFRTATFSLPQKLDISHSCSESMIAMISGEDSLGGIAFHGTLLLWLALNAHDRVGVRLDEGAACELVVAHWILPMGRQIRAADGHEQLYYYENHGMPSEASLKTHLTEMALQGKKSMPFLFLSFILESANLLRLLFHNAVKRALSRVSSRFYCTRPTAFSGCVALIVRRS